MDADSGRSAWLWCPRPASRALLRPPPHHCMPRDHCSSSEAMSVSAATAPPYIPSRSVAHAFQCATFPMLTTRAAVHLLTHSEVYPLNVLSRSSGVVNVLFGHGQKIIYGCTCN